MQKDVFWLLGSLQVSGRGAQRTNNQTRPQKSYFFRAPPKRKCFRFGFWKPAGKRNLASEKSNQQPGERRRARQKAKSEKKNSERLLRMPTMTDFLTCGFWDQRSPRLGTQVLVSFRGGGGPRLGKPPSLGPLVGSVTSQESKTW